MISAAPHSPQPATPPTAVASSDVGRPPEGDSWLALSSAALPVATAAAWVVRPECGGLVLFSGTARDHAPGRTGVQRLEYEAYEDYVQPIFAGIADQARSQAADQGHMLGRVLIWHRIGVVELADSAVVVAVSAPHRPEAFAAARLCIDTVKATAPIWKREVWDGGAGWGTSDGA